MILFIILVVGLLFLGLIIKLVEGALKIFLIVLLLIILAISGFFSSNNASGPSTSLQIPQASKDA